MLKASQTRRKRKRPGGLKYRNVGDYVMPDGTKVLGLKRRPDGRFYAAQKPSKTFGKDPAEAVFRYKQWLASEGKETTLLLEPVNFDWEPEWWGKRDPTEEDQREAEEWARSVHQRLAEYPEYTRTTDKMESLIEVPSDLLYAKARSEILRDPKLFAKKVGIPEIGYLEKLEPPPPPLTLAEAGEIYHSEKEGEISPKQWKNSRNWWAEFCQDVKPVEFVDDLKRDVFQAYASRAKTRQRQKSDKTGKPRGVSWRRSRFATVATILNYMKDAGKISPELHNRVRQAWKQPLKMPKQAKGRKYLIKPEEFHAMLAKADDFMKALLLLGVNAALPSGDFDVQWEHISFDDKTMAYRRTKTDSGSVEGVLRIAVLWDTTCDALKKLGRVDCPYVFSTQTGRPVDPSTVWDRFTALRKKAGLSRPLRPEDLRNTAATIAAENAPKAQYDVLMGHSLGSDDEGYIEKHRFFTREACEAIGDYLGVT